MINIDKHGQEISDMDIYLKPPIYREVKRIIDDYYAHMNRHNKSEFIDIFKTIEDTIDRCIVVVLFEKYGDIKTINKMTKMSTSLIRNKITECGLESIYGDK